MTQPEAYEDSRDSASLTSRLRHVYWIGGASGSGKSTIARRLADRHGLRLYRRTGYGRPCASMVARGLSEPGQFVKMSMDQRWVDRSPQTMLETFHWFRGEGFDLIIEDLLALPPDQGVIAEGFRLLPHLVKPLLHDPSHCVWLIPTPEFRLAAFESRGTMWSIPNKTSNPKRALSNLLERDQLFTERLQGMVETTGLPAVTVDGRLTRTRLRAASPGNLASMDEAPGPGRKSLTSEASCDDRARAKRPVTRSSRSTRNGRTDRTRRYVVLASGDQSDRAQRGSASSVRRISDSPVTRLVPLPAS